MIRLKNLLPNTFLNEQDNTIYYNYTEKAYSGIHWNRDAILYRANFRISDISLSFIQGGLGSEVTIVKALSHL